MFIKKMTTCLSISMLIFSFSASAKTMICPFQDYFLIYAPANTQILFAHPDNTGKLKYTQPSPTFFFLSCGDDNLRESGDVIVGVGKDESEVCSLTIHDGPYEMNPSIKNVSCYGGL